MSLRKLLLFSLLSLLAACGEQKLPSPFKASDVSAKYAQADFQLNDASRQAGQPGGLSRQGRGAVLRIYALPAGMSRPNSPIWRR